MNMHHPPRKFSLTIKKQGATEYQKISFPIHTGIYSQLETENVIFQFNLNNEILRAKGKGETWPHPHEWLKRNLANDWTYYSTGGYTGVYEAIGEYYLPNFTYPTNNLLGGRPFDLPEVHNLAANWHRILQNIYKETQFSDETNRQFFDDVLVNSPERLAARQKALHELIGGPVSVLPPDARHVDYNIIPFPISRGCLYKCRFCKVKNHQPFTLIEREKMEHLASQLTLYLDADLVNYNGVFLGDHDGLQAGANQLVFAAELAYQKFQLGKSYCRDSRFFLFGSVGSLLGSPESLFKELNSLPSLTYINIGLESADQATLDKIGKPLRAEQIAEAFGRIQEINQRYPKLEVTANFIMDDDLPQNHYPSILHLIRDSQTFNRPKGTIYFSPLSFSAPSRSKLFEFHRLKVLSRFPTFLYIIQRL